MWQKTLNNKTLEALTLEAYNLGAYKPRAHSLEDYHRPSDFAPSILAYSSGTYDQESNIAGSAIGPQISHHRSWIWNRTHQAGGLGARGLETLWGTLQRKRCLGKHYFIEFLCRFFGRRPNKREAPK